MGLTTTTIHIPFSKSLSQAVSEEMFEKIPGESLAIIQEVDSCVVMQSDEAAACVPLVPLKIDMYDKDVLLDIACQISKKADVLTLVCSTEDSDFYEFVIYKSGVQFDYLSNTEVRDSNERVSEKAKRWIDILGLASSTEEVRKVLKKAIVSDSVFVEDILLELGSLFHVPEHALLGSDVLGSGERATILRYLGNTDSNDREGGVPPILTYSLSDKQYAPHLRTYPAAFPMSVGEACTFSWHVLSEAGGFNGCTVLVESDDWKDLALKQLSVRALPWYRGNVSSPKEYAAFDTELDDTSTSLYSIDIHDFAIPDIQSDSDKKILLLLTLTLEASEKSIVEFSIRIIPHRWEKATVCLPAIRLEARAPSWIPFVSGLHPQMSVKTWAEESSKELLIEQSRTQKKREILLLNGESFQLQQALFASSLQAALSVVQEYVAQMFAGCVLDNLFVRVNTHKHMTAAGSVSKTVANFNVEEIIQTALWKRAFKEKSKYQYISIEIYMEDMSHAVAGFYVQQPLRADSPGAELEESLHFTQWSIHHPEIALLLGSDVSSWSYRFSEWIAIQDVYQAWSTRVSEVEPFDLYEEYHESLYEQCCLRSFFYEMKKGTLMHRDWLTQFVRFIAPQMWLSEKLLSKCRYDLIEDCATVTDCGSLKMLTLKEERSLNDLEGALLPLLPLEKKRIESAMMKYNI